MFDTVDIVVGTIINSICQFSDDNFNTTFGKDIGPLLYVTYMCWSDPGGTIARAVEAVGATLTGMDYSDVELVITDDFERTLLTGTAFNMWDYYDPPE